MQIKQQQQQTPLYKKSDDEIKQIVESAFCQQEQIIQDSKIHLNTNLVESISQQYQQNQFNNNNSNETKSFNIGNNKVQIVIPIRQLIQTQIRPLHQYKQLLYNKFIHKDIISQSNLDLVYVRCLYETPFPPQSSFQSSFVKNPSKTKFQQVQSGYVYTNTQEKDLLEWYVNFADKELFGYYFSGLFAQDEIQTSENPLLYHLREEAVNRSKQFKELKPVTYEDKNPTPILILNSLREGEVNTNPTPNNQNGLYGNNFALAQASQIDQQSKKINDLYSINFICMCSLQQGQGSYTLEQINFTFQTAYKAFREAYLFRRLLGSEQKLVQISTGNWGCGAFGNNLELIAILQFLAAEVAQIDVLKYYTFNNPGFIGYSNGLNKYNQIKKELTNFTEINSYEQYIEKFLQKVFQQKFQWSKSDGN